MPSVRRSLATNRKGMKNVRILTGLAVILLLCVLAVGSQKESDRNSGAAEKGVIKVTLTLGGGPFGPVRERYHVGEGITVVVWMTNTAPEPVKVCSYHTLAQDRPVLLKEGRPLAYREELAKVLKRYDSGEGCQEVTYPPVMVELQPQKSTTVGWFVLSQEEGKSANIKWYEPLKAGRYQLSIRRSLGCCMGPGVESDALSFEVVL
jgi:hypothetical protein